jgi:hypothetical protein
VYAKWSTLPEATRPKLIAQGISLGSFGMQGAFSGVQDLTERPDGALFLGTPSFTEMWADLTDNRDPGSLERQPVVDKGKEVRWGEQTDHRWDQPRLARRRVGCPSGGVRAARIRRGGLVVAESAVGQAGPAERISRTGCARFGGLVPGGDVLPGHRGPFVAGGRISRRGTATSTDRNMPTPSPRCGRRERGPPTTRPGSRSPSVT